MFTVDHPHGQWNINHVRETNLSGQIEYVAGSIEGIDEGIAPEFDITQAYHIGDVVKYDHHVYIFVKEHAANTEITPDEVQETSIGAELQKTNEQIAPEFSATSVYHAGDIVRYHGDLYIFHTDKGIGSWDPSYVSLTNVTTQIELLPDQIIQYVGQQGYNKTFIQMTDPTLDPEKTVAEGDYWIQAEPGNYLHYIMWGSVLASHFSETQAYRVGDAVEHNGIVYIFTQAHEGVWNASAVREKTNGDTLPINNDDPNVRTWQTTKSLNWGLYSGCAKLMSWDGEQWVTVYDTSTEAVAFTRIEQNKNAITLEAERANAAEGELNAKITLTADKIRQEVSQGYTSKAFFQMTSDGKIQLVSSNFSSLGSTTSGIYITPAAIDLNSGGALTVKSSGTLTISSGGALNINSGANMTIASGGNMTLSSGSSLNINSGGALSIASGGKFSLTSTYFTVTETGVITAKSGQVGGWYIGSNYIGNASTYATSSIGLMSTATGSTIAIWAGDTRESGHTPTFYVRANGNLYANNGVFGGTVYAKNIDTTGGAIKGDQIASTTITGSNIASTTIASGNLQTGVQNNISNGQSIYQTMNNAINGTASLTSLYVNAFTIDGTFYKYNRNTRVPVQWITITDGSGTDHMVLGYT